MITCVGDSHPSSLRPEQLQGAKRLAQSPVLAKYNQVLFPAPDASCEGSQVQVSNLKGSFRCACSCQPPFVELPHDLRAYLDELDEFRRQSIAQLQPLQPTEIGLLAVQPGSSLWESSFDQVPDEHWQTLELPIDLGTLTAHDPSTPMRISDPAVNTQLRSLLAQHQAWQRAEIHPSWMYLRDTTGQRVVLGMTELMEP